MEKTETIQETVKREFTTTIPTHLKVGNIRGSVTVRQNDGDEGVVTVTAVKHVDTGDADRTNVEIEQKEDGHLVIKTVFEEGAWWFFGRYRPCRVDYVVGVPGACVLQVRCVSSSTLIQDLEGEFNLKTVSGRVTLSNLSGKIKVVSVSGKIVGARLSGPTEFESVSGKVFLTESDLPVVRGTCVSGDLVLETPLGEGPYRLKTVSGDAKLILPSESGCVVGFNSMSGRFKTCLTTTRIQRRSRRTCATLQDGGPHVHFSSMSGDLAVTQSPG